MFRSRLYYYDLSVSEAITRSREQDKERAFIDGERMVDEKVEYWYYVSTPKMTYIAKKDKYKGDRNYTSKMSNRRCTTNSVRCIYEVKVK